MPQDDKPPLIDMPNLSLAQKLRTFLGHYDLRVYLTDTAYVDIGRGSFGAVWHIFPVCKTFHGCLGTIGQFCDFALTSNLHGGGEHQNNLPVNVMMTSVTMFHSMIADNQITALQEAPHKPFMISNAIVLSEDVRVLPGSKIGDGSLIGACSLVRGEVEPFSIYAGSPARKIKNRCDPATSAALAAVRWWDFDITYLGQNLHRLQEIAVDTGSTHIYKKPQPRLVIKLTDTDRPDTKANILGFLNGEQLFPLTSAPEKVRQYLNQLATDGPYYWLANMWDDYNTVATP